MSIENPCSMGGASIPEYEYNMRREREERARAARQEQPAADQVVCQRCNGGGTTFKGVQCYRCYGTGIDPAVVAQPTVPETQP